MKTGILLTVRLKSTRLKRKALLEVGGKPLLLHLIDRMRRSSFGENVVVMTSDLPEDEPLIDFAEKIGVRSFAGDPVDVLVRMRDAAHHFDFERVVSATGDNPFVDPDCLDLAVQYQSQSQADLVTIEGIPWGTFCYVLTRTGLDIACEDKEESDTEVWGDYFRKNQKLIVDTLKITDPALVWPDLRLTVDTEEDFQMISAIASNVPYDSGLKEIIAFCREHPEVVAINANIKQKNAKPAKLRSDESI